MTSKELTLAELIKPATEIEIAELIRQLNQLCGEPNPATNLVRRLVYEHDELLKEVRKLRKNQYS